MDYFIHIFLIVSSLSQGDIAYIKQILLGMPEEKKWLYFPIVVLPDKKWYHIGVLWMETNWLFRMNPFQ